MRRQVCSVAGHTNGLIQTTPLGSRGPEGGGRPGSRVLRQIDLSGSHTASFLHSLPMTRPTQQGCSRPPHAVHTPESEQNRPCPPPRLVKVCFSSGQSPVLAPGAGAQHGRPSAPQVISQNPSLLQEGKDRRDGGQLLPAQQSSPRPPQAAQTASTQVASALHTGGVPSSDTQQRKPLAPQLTPAHALSCYSRCIEQCTVHSQAHLM